MSARAGSSNGDARAEAIAQDSIAKNTAFSYATQLTTASLTAVLTIFLTRRLGPEEYGVFALAVSASAIALGLADFGISSSTARFLAEHGHHRRTAGEIFVDSLKLKLLVTGAMAGALALLAPVIAHAYHEPNLVWPVRGIALAMLGQSCLLMLTWVNSGLGRTAMNLRLVAIESVLEVSASITLVLLGAGAAGAAFGRAFGYVTGATIGIALVHRLLGSPRLDLRRLPAGSTVRRVGGYASSLFLVDTAFTLSQNVNVVMLGSSVGAAASGMFQAPMRLITFLQYPGLAVASGVAPRLARRGGREPDAQALQAALRGLILFQAVLLAPAVIWARPITHLLLGPAYGEAADALKALAPYVWFSGLAPVVSVSVNYLGEARRRVPIALITLAVIFGTAILLIPRHGVVGAAIATDAAYGFYTCAHLWLCHRLLRLELAPLARALASAVAAAGGMSLVLLSVGTGDLPAPVMLLGGAAAVLAYVVTLTVTRQVVPHDLARLAALARATLHSVQARGRRRVRIRRLGPAAEPPAWVGNLRATYEIAWRSNGGSGVFELRPLPAGKPSRGADGAVVVSRRIRWDQPTPPPAIPEVVEAHALLVRRILHGGWRRAGSGNAWYSERFRRSPRARPRAR